MQRQRIAAVIESVVRSVVASVEGARADERPFLHLRLSRVFPEDVYERMLGSMPAADDYRSMSGRAKESVREDGTPTRLKLDLLPEHTRGLPVGQRQLWEGIGRALCSREVQAALVRRLAPALERRFGTEFRRLRLFPLPVLTRDVPSYHVPPHTDTHWKGITVQFYLPRDDAAAHVGTLFHQVTPDGRKARAGQMPFVPNSGYAFAVGGETWHSVDVLGPEVARRDSILLTYFVDAGWLRFVRNRGKRVGNIVLGRLRMRSRALGVTRFATPAG